MKRPDRTKSQYLELSSTGIIFELTILGLVILIFIEEYEKLRESVNIKNMFEQNKKEESKLILNIVL